jgi:hypothetical protein
MQQSVLNHQLNCEWLSLTIIDLVIIIMERTHKNGNIK